MGERELYFLDQMGCAPPANRHARDFWADNAKRIIGLTVSPVLARGGLAWFDINLAGQITVQARG